MNAKKLRFLLYRMQEYKGVTFFVLLFLAAAAYFAASRIPPAEYVTIPFSFTDVEKVVVDSDIFDVVVEPADGETVEGTIRYPAKLQFAKAKADYARKTVFIEAKTYEDVPLMPSNRFSGCKVVVKLPPAVLQEFNTEGKVLIRE